MKYFTIDELCRSDIARQRNIPNNPTIEARENLRVLIEKLLNPIREEWGKPIRVNSGFRAGLLNKAVGGAHNSQHMTGEAADITTGSKLMNKNLFDMIVAGGYSFDQLIWEKGDSTGPDWIHISFRQGRNRNQILHLK